MKSYFTRKEQLVILIIVISITSILGFKFFHGKIMAKDLEKDEIIVDLNKNKEKEDDISEQSGDVEEIQNTDKDIEEYSGDIIVHISGQVKNPGIVELSSGKRLIDAVEVLGGLTIEADTDRINLAKKLQDEEKIYIPKIGEILEESVIEIVDSSNSNLSGDSDNNSDMIDINICTKEELNTLPGIGEVLSTRIIDFREEKFFKSIEEIMDVSGIGVKKFEGIKELIIVK